jgi:ABC-type nitrate/sulfonate/bicarbonate transport system substrate-binding protein
MFQGFPEIKEALMSNKMQAGFMVAPMAIALRAQGVPIKIVYLGHRYGSAVVVAKILAYETGVPNVADPLGGSYYVEALTDGLEREAEGLFAEIEAQGGVVRAIESGWFQRQISF